MLSISFEGSREEEANKDDKNKREYILTDGYSSLVQDSGRKRGKI